MEGSLSCDRFKNTLYSLSQLNDPSIVKSNFRLHYGGIIELWQIKKYPVFSFTAQWSHHSEPHGVHYGGINEAWWEYRATMVGMLEWVWSPHSLKCSHHSGPILSTVAHHFCCKYVFRNHFSKKFRQYWKTVVFVLFWLIGLKSQWAYLIINHKLCTICLWTHSDGAHGGRYTLPLPTPTHPYPYLPLPLPTPAHPYPYLPLPLPTPTTTHPCYK